MDSAQVQDVKRRIDELRTSLIAAYDGMRNLSEEMRTLLSKDAIGDHLLTVNEAAAKFRVSAPTIYRWMKDGTITPFRVGSKVLVDGDSIKATPMKRRRTSARQN